MKILLSVLVLLAATVTQAGIITIDINGHRTHEPIVSEGVADIYGDLDNLSIRVTSGITEPIEVLEVSTFGNVYQATINTLGYDSGVQDVGYIEREDGYYQLSGLSGDVYASGTYETMIDGVVESGTFSGMSDRGINLPNIIYDGDDLLVVQNVSFSNFFIRTGSFNIRFAGKINGMTMQTTTHAVPEAASVTLALLAVICLAVRRQR